MTKRVGAIVVTAVVLGVGAYYLDYRFVLAETPQPTPVVSPILSPEPELPSPSPVTEASPLPDSPQKVTAKKANEFVVGSQLQKKGAPVQNMILELPEGMVANDQTLKLGSFTYRILTDKDFPNPCVVGQNGCSVSSQAFPPAKSLKIWKNADGIIALSLSEITIQGYTTPSVLIKKLQPSNVFSLDEWEAWESIFHGFRLEPAQ